MIVAYNQCLNGLNHVCKVLLKNDETTARSLLADRVELTADNVRGIESLTARMAQEKTLTNATGKGFEFKVGSWVKRKIGEEAFLELNAIIRNFEVDLVVREPHYKRAFGTVEAKGNAVKEPTHLRRMPPWIPRGLPKTAGTSKMPLK